MKMKAFALISIIASLALAGCGGHTVKPLIIAGFTQREATVYARAWVDGAAPPGFFSSFASCKAGSAGWNCRVHTNNGFCFKMFVEGYKFKGPANRCSYNPAA